MSRQNAGSTAPCGGPGPLKCHERCTVCDPGSRSGHGAADPCTHCGQLCGQLGTFRGQAKRSRIRPQFAVGVPTARHGLCTSTPRSLACGNDAASTPSTLPTTAVVVISSRTLLLTSVGDEQLDRGGATAKSPSKGTVPRNDVTATARTNSAALPACLPTPGYQQGPDWPYGGTPRGTTPRTAVVLPGDPQTAVSRISLLDAARPRPWRSSR